jgi:hypothetical protein
MEALDYAEKNENHHGTMIDGFSHNSLIERD